MDDSLLTVWYENATSSTTDNSARIDDELTDSDEDTQDELPFLDIQ